MKTRLILASALALIAAPLLQAEPAMPIEKAVAVAQSYLRDNGLAARTTIVSISYERAAVTSSRSFWVAKFEPSVERDGKRETGLQIAANGELTRLIKASAAERAREAEQRRRK